MMLLPIVAKAYDAFIDGIYYNFNGNEAEVTYKKKYKGNIVIPESVTYNDKTYSVTGIGEWAFYRCYNLTSITIPESVTCIGDHAFYHCKNLTSITFPNSVTSIDSHTFEGCTSLTSITIPNSVTSISDYAFYLCTSLTSVTIGSNVASIGSGAFYFCTNLTTVVIPKNVKRIGKSAFAQCKRLKTVIGIHKEIDMASDAFPPEIRKQIIPADYYISQNSSATNSEQKRLNDELIAQNPSREPQGIDLDIPVSPSDNENTFAVIIGNENYTQVAHVPYATNDARIFAEYCKKTLGLPKNNVRKYEDATFGNILVAISDIKNIAKAYNGDINIIFYYAGHGIPDETTRDAFLLPVDANGQQTEACFPLSRLYRELGELGTKNVTVFLDACFSGTQRGDGMLASARGVFVVPRIENLQGNIVVFSAATGEETAYPYEEKGHGLFTYFLLKKLHDTKGNCTLGELSEYIQTNVCRQSVVVNRKSQTPTIVPSQALMNSWRTMKLK